MSKMSMSEKLTYEEEKAIYSDLQARQAELVAQERAEAYAAVAKALAGWRWWHWGNLVNRFRLWMQGWRKNA